MDKLAFLVLIMAFVFIGTKETNAQGTFKLHQNGVTISCENVAPGDTGSVAGVIYTAVDNESIRDSVSNAADMTKLCTSSVTDMSSMFEDAYNFNQEIGNWDVSSVTDMWYMFHNATNFNQYIGGWDVSAVTTMVHMFGEAESFNQDIGQWDVSAVTYMSSMFEGTEFFNQDIGGWDVSAVTDMRDMFKNAINFNRELGNWDVSSVYYMYGMFEGSQFNQDIGSWDVSSVIRMYDMFRNATKFNQDLSDWCVSRFSDEPENFATSSALSIDHYPIWGTCPDITPTENESEIPTELTLSQNYPNPFNPTTNIEYEVPEAGFITIAVYDLLGQKVAELANGFKSEGSYITNFNGKGLASGVYVYQLQTPTQILSRQMLLVK